MEIVESVRIGTVSTAVYWPHNFEENHHVSGVAARTISWTESESVPDTIIREIVPDTVIRSGMRCLL